MAKDATTVYLEDIDPSYATKRRRLDEDDPKEQKAPTAAPVKRQRTLDGMISVSQSKKGATFFSPSGSKVLGISSQAVGITSDAAVNGLLKLNAIPFSMKEYQESLSIDEKRLLQLECETMGKVWLKVLKEEIRKSYFLSLKQFLWKEGVQGVQDVQAGTTTVYPPPSKIYSWSQTPLGKLKVVILGQDPYHGRGQAHGLCFSVPVGISVPPSLRNIYTELKAEYPEFNIPNHGNLSAWANSGVLMLNACLTVRAGEANSHANKGWEQFTDRVLEMVDKYGGANLPSGGSSGGGGTGFGRGVVFLAWGAYAARRVSKLDKTKHLILTGAHPSPFSADKGFFGNGHFQSANKWLEERYGADGRVDWCALD